MLSGVRDGHPSFPPQRSLPLSLSGYADPGKPCGQTERSGRKPGPAALGRGRGAPSAPSSSSISTNIILIASSRREAPAHHRAGETAEPAEPHTLPLPSRSVSVSRSLRAQFLDITLNKPGGREGAALGHAHRRIPLAPGEGGGL